MSIMDSHYRMHRGDTILWLKQEARLKKAMAKICNLKTFTRELEYKYETGGGDLALYPRDLKMLPSEKRGDCNGYAQVTQSSNTRKHASATLFWNDQAQWGTIQTYAIHEMAHVAIFKLILNDSNMPEYYRQKHGERGKEAWRREWQGHGQPFRGLVLAAYQEYFRIKPAAIAELLCVYAEAVKVNARYREKYGSRYSFGLNAYIMDTIINAYVTQRESKVDLKATQGTVVSQAVANLKANGNPCKVLG